MAATGQRRWRLRHVETVIRSERTPVWSRASWAWTLSTRGATSSAVTNDCTARRLGSSKSSSNGGPSNFFGSTPTSATAAGWPSAIRCRRRIEDQHRLGGELEQQPIALLGVADAVIFALHLLLRLGDALLQRRERPKIAAERHDVVVRAKPHRAIADRDVGAFFCGMVDLSPARSRALSRVPQQFLDLGAAVDSDNLRKAPADPTRYGSLANSGSENAASRTTPSLSTTSAMSAADAIRSPAASASIPRKTSAAAEKRDKDAGVAASITSLPRKL